MITFIFLVIIGSALIGFNLRAIKKEKDLKSYNFNEKLNEKKENINDYDIQIGELRKEIAETILEIQEQINCIEDKYEELKLKLYNQENYSSKIKENNNSSLNAKEKIYIENKLTRNKIKKSKNINKDILKDDNKDINNIKVDTVNSLLKEGISVEEVAKKLQIGKGEVLLIKDLYKK